MTLFLQGWFRKQTDSGLKLNFHSLAPIKYKRSVVNSVVYKVSRACSNWKHFHIGLEEAIQMLRDNQYPNLFIDPIIKTILCKLVDRNHNASFEDNCDVDCDMTVDANNCVHSVSEKGHI